MKSFSNEHKKIKFKFYHKLSAAFGIMGLIMILIFLLGNQTLRYSSDFIEKSFRNKIQPLVQITKLQSDLDAIRYLEIDLSCHSKSLTVSDKIDLLKKNIQKFETDLGRFTNELLQKESDTAKQLTRNWREYHTRLMRTQQYARDEGLDEARKSAMHGSSPYFQNFYKIFEHLALAKEHKAQQELATSIAQLKKRWHTFLFIAIGGLFIGIISIVMLSISVCGRIKSLKTGVKSLVEKNWRHSLEIKGNDEITDLTISFIEMSAELYQREQALIASELKYRTLIENLPEQIFYKDMDSVYVACNDNYAMLYDQVPEEIEGKTDYDFFSKETAEKYIAEDRRIIASEKTEAFEEKFFRDGREIWFHTIKTPVRNNKGHITGILGVLRDISTQKKASEKLRVSEENFRQLAENINNAFFLIDRESLKTIYVSPAYEKIWGQPAAALFEDSSAFTSPVHPEDLEAVRTVYAKLKDNEHFNHEYRIFHPDGTIRWIRDRTFPIQNDDGNVYRFARLAEDITERKTLSDLIQKNEERYRSLFENNHAVMLLIDPESGNIIDANPAACRFYGYNQTVITHKNITDINLSPREKVLQEMQSTLIKRRRVYTFRHRLADGDIRDVEIFSVALHIDGKELLYSIIHDITDRIQAENQIRQRLRIENTLAQSAKMLISTEDADLNQYLKLLGEAFAVDRACIFRAHDSGRQASMSHEWCSPAMQSRITELQALNTAEYSWFPNQQSSTGEGGGSADCRLPRDHSANPETLPLDNNCSSLCVPIFSNRNTLCGFMFFESMEEGRQWLAEDMEALGLAAEIVGVHWKQRQAQKLLKSERERLSKFLDGNPIPTFIIGKRHRVSLWNRACANLTGIGKDEVIGKRLTSSMFQLEPADNPLLANLVLDMNEKSLLEIYGATDVSKCDLIPDAFEAFTQLDFGEGPQDFLLHAARVYDSKGDVLGVIETLQDITKQKRAMKALVESEKRFRALVENTLIGICIIQNDEFVYMNPKLKQLFGKITDTFRLKDMNIHPEDSENFKQSYDIKRLSNQKTLDQIIRFFPFKNKTEHSNATWVNCRSSIIEYKGQKAALITMGDITHAKELEKVVQIREKMASLGNVAAGIAHEIRNPLSGINIMLDGINETFEDPENAEDIKELIVQAQKATHKIESVIKRVLDFSRPSEARLTETDIHIPAREAISLCKTSLRKAGIQLEVAPERNLPPVYIDSQLIEQVVLNLINNAAESMRDSQTRKIINISSDRIHNHIVLKIADSGPGVPNELKEKIFDPFFTTKVYGSGIGLSICQRIISDHGGKINVSSADLGGAEFIIQIPIEKRKI